METIAIRDKWEKKRQDTITKNKEFQNDLQGLTSGRSTVSNILKLVSKADNINNLKQNINEVSDLIHFFNIFIQIFQILNFFEKI